MNTREIVELLERLENHYDEPVPVERIERWEKALVASDAGAIAEAADQYMVIQPRFFPKPAELLDIARSLPVSSGKAEPLPPRRRPMRDMSAEQRSKYEADCLAKYESKHPETAELYPPHLYPGRGPARFLHAHKQMTEPQQKAFEAGLTQEMAHAS